MQSLRLISRILLSAGLCLPLVVQAATPARQAVDNLFYGDALFHYFQDRPFDTIVRILAYDARDRLGSDRGEARLMLAGIPLSWGQTDAAERDFRQLLSDDAAPSIRNRAWFQLGRIAYARDQFDQVRRSLARIDPEWGDQAQKGERRLLQALAELKSGDTQAARKSLAGTPASPLLQRYLSYNLGVILARDGLLDEAVQAWDKAVIDRPRNGEQAALSDLADSVAGHVLLHAGRNEAAARRLARVRLQGPYSDKALLGYGLALFRQGQKERAIGVWQALLDRGSVSAATLEARLAIPYALAELGAFGQAAEGYREAIEHFDARHGRLVALVQRLEQGPALRGLLEALSANERDSAEEKEFAVWLHGLFASNLFEETLRNYRDLQVMHARLKRWQEDLPTFRLMLSERRARFDSRVPRLEHFRSSVNTAPLHEEWNSLDQSLARIRETRDATALANAREQMRLKRLAGIEASLLRLPPSQQRDALLHKAGILRGLQLWQLHKVFPERSWQLEKELREIRKSLAELDASLSGVDELEATARAGFSGFAHRIDELERQLPGRLAAVERLIVDHERALREEMLHRIRARLSRLALYRTRARYALARIHDRAISGGKEGAGP